jgi:hypothetical protein
MMQARCPGNNERDGRCCRLGAPRPNFYRDALDAQEQALLDAADTAPGLDDEVALLRVLLHRVLTERPADLRLLFQGLTNLMRLVVARGRLPTVTDETARLERIAHALEDELVADENAPGGDGV